MNFRELIVNVMIKSVAYWEVATQETKIELCEKSKMWLDVLKTADFVLNYCPRSTKGKEVLEQAVFTLQEHLRIQEKN